MSGLAGEAFVAIWHDIAPEGLATFYAWHNREHMPERLGIPGFRRGRRYASLAGAPHFFNLYEVDTFEVLVGQDYLNRLNNPTDWTRRAVTHFRNVTRGLCRVASSQGIGQGGVIATLRIAAAPGHDEELRRHLTREVAPVLLEHLGVVGIHLGFTDEAGSRIETAEKKVRGSATDVPPWVLLVEAIDREHVEAAMRDVLADTTLARAGATSAIVRAIYRLESARLKTARTAG
jgi:hypothetical protein